MAEDDRGIEDRRRGPPLGLPARAVTVRASDRLLGTCPHRWWFRRGLGLDAPSSAAQSYGRAWHAALEDVHRWWMEGRGPWPADGGYYCPWCGGSSAVAGGAPCDRCGETGRGPVERARHGWLRAACREGSHLDPDDARADGERLDRAFGGWLRVHGSASPDGWRVVAVEVGIGVPVPSPTGERTYRPTVYVTTRPDGTERISRAHEAVRALPPGWSAREEAREVWLSVRLDCAWLHEPTHTLRVGEWKSSDDPRGYVQGLTVDPQVALYQLALGDAARRGLLAMPSPDCAGGVATGARCVGYWYDVSSSRLQRDPVELKGRTRKDGSTTGGGLSTAQQTLASVPSWRLEAALADRGLSSDPEWQARVAEQRLRVDRNLYLREWGGLDAGAVDRVRRELSAEAQVHVARLRAAARAEGPEDVDRSFPRVPVCRLPGGGCPYRGPCVSDGPGARLGLLQPDDDPWAVPDDPVDADADAPKGRSWAPAGGEHLW